MYLGTLADPRGDVIQEIHYADNVKFDFVEISVEGPKYTLENLEPKVPEINRLKNELGLFFTCHTPWGWNIGNPYEKIRGATVGEVMKVIDFAESIEARLVTVHMHTRFGLYDKKEIIKNMAGSLSILCDRAEKSGIAITVENVDQGVDDMKALFELEPRAKFHLDIGHANLLCKDGSNIYAFIETFKDRLYHVHAHDNKGGHNVDGDLHLALGMGNIDWPKVVGSLKDAGYKETVTFEVFTRNRQYLETSRDIFKTLMGGWAEQD
ncbi:sugar phosphate isomerase/epimerase [Methanocella sp. CWC-04]|uniref:Sugar phosphate isomerase/epimerase n=1 Tax=Methanooceanicella nereidis TaxID=2052831 RepID=A0AAP2RDM0_9EURY|nr:sugar phosphate isomerase/epimerase [Methanocella sp. CWC-04]MCD1294665.1 sugar phosphate isomerase/epimerase [Methanocella sp. CWC-04]